MSKQASAGRPAPPVRCRPIGPADLDSVVALLAEGFPARRAGTWRLGLARYLARRAPGAPTPDLGFVLEAAGEPVGVLLTLWGAGADNDPEAPLCNLSSWYVRPAFRLYAGLLDQVAQRRRDVTYLNISAIRSTWPVHEARGFRRFSTGQYVAVPLLARPRSGVRIAAFGVEPIPRDITTTERRLLADHHAYGCVSLIATDERGSAPLVFIRKPVAALQVRLGFSPVVYHQLVYCRSTADIPRFAHALGRHLLAVHRMPWLLLDADGPVPGLPGRFVPGRGIKFARGPVPMRKGDLSYTELVYFHD